jgi:uncharacterized protein (DUF302 family)
MKNLMSSLVARMGRNALPSAGNGVTNGSAEHRPFRLWMTSSLAVVMLSICAARNPVEEERFLKARTVRHSPFNVDETLRRIEAAARHQGLSVLARLEGAQPMIVLASSVGGTPVVMDRSDTSRPDMPLSVEVRESMDGGADVFIAMAPDDADTDWFDLPPSVVNDIATLPYLVDVALT